MCKTWINVTYLYIPTFSHIQLNKKIIILISKWQQKCFRWNVRFLPRVQLELLFCFVLNKLKRTTMHLHIFQWKPFISPWHNSAPSHRRKQSINLTRGATENIKVKTESKRRNTLNKLFTTSRSYLPWKGAEQPLILKEVNTVRSFTKDLTMSAVSWTHQAQNTAITDKLTFIFQHSFDIETSTFYRIC